MSSSEFGFLSEPTWAILPGNCHCKMPMLFGQGIPHCSNTPIHDPCIFVAAGKGMPLLLIIGCSVFMLWNYATNPNPKLPLLEFIGKVVLSLLGGNIITLGCQCTNARLKLNSIQNIGNISLYFLNIEGDIGISLNKSILGRIRTVNCNAIL